MRKIYIIIVFIFILFISSCASSGGNNVNNDSAVDGTSFDYYESYTINQVEYQIYIPSDVKDVIYYQYKVGEVKSSSSEWRVNFIYNVIYHVDATKEDKTVWDSLYLKLSDVEVKTELSELCGFDVSILPPDAEVETEFVLRNENKEEASYVTLYYYLPLRLVNTKTRYTQTIGVPIKVDLLLKVNEQVESPFEDKMILWEDFLAIVNF